MRPTGKGEPWVAKEIPKPAPDAAREWRVLRSELMALERIRARGKHHNLAHLHDVREGKEGKRGEGRR